MPSLKHIHRYKRHLTKVRIYFCADPDCSHYMPDKELLVGKRSRCNKCGTEFILDRKMHLNSLLPVCLQCSRRTKKKEIMEIATDMLNDLFNEVKS